MRQRGRADPCRSSPSGRRGRGAMVPAAFATEESSAGFRDPSALSPVRASAGRATDRYSSRASRVNCNSPMAAKRRMARHACRSIISTATAPLAATRAASVAKVSASTSRTTSRRAPPSSLRRSSTRSAFSPSRWTISATNSSCGEITRGPPRAGPAIIACIRSMKAPRPDGIFRAARSPVPSSTPLTA